jgi:hypothetical protein
MENECGKLLNEHLQQIANARSAIHWQIPTTFCGMQDITLDIPAQLVANDMVLACEAEHVRFAVDMSPLFTLHLRSITIVLDLTNVTYPNYVTRPNKRDSEAFQHLVSMTGMGASDLPLDHPLFDPTKEPNTRRIVLDARETAAAFNGKEDCHSVIGMRTHREAWSWETWTMHLPQGKTLLVWIREVDGKEEESTKLWVERVPKAWTRYPHAGWPME